MQANIFLSPSEPSDKNLFSAVDIFDWPAEEREMFEERAAIMEFEAGLSREEAEYLAYRLIKQRRLKWAV